MSVLDILHWPDARLSMACAAIPEITPEVKDLAADMLETMYAAPGRGLAGPQVGAILRIFVMDTTWKDGVPDPMVFINPIVDGHSDTQVENFEGCLSIPALSVLVSRPNCVHLAWTSLDGAANKQAFEGFAAACIQHEMDHLNGIVTLDHLSAADRAGLLAGYQGIGT